MHARLFLVSMLLVCVALVWIDPASPQDPVRDTPAARKVVRPLPPGAIARLGPSQLKLKVAVTGLAFSPDGKWFASGGGDGEVGLWDGGTLQEVHHLRGLFGSEARVLFSPDSKTLAGAAPGGDPGVIVWDVTTGKERWRGPDATRALAFSPDGKWLACGLTTGPISLRDASTGKERLQIKGHDEAVGHLVFRNGGRTLASVGRHRTLCQWDVSTGKQISRVKSADASAEALCFSPDGKYLVTQPLATEILVWELAAARPNRSLRSAANLDDTIMGSSGAISPDGKWLAVGDPANALHLWDLGSGKEFWRGPEYPAPVKVGSPISMRIGPKLRHRERVTAVAFSQDGRTLASGCWDGLVLFWDVGGMGPNPLLGRQPGWPVELVFTPDSKRLICSSAEAVCLWEAGRRRVLYILAPAKVSPDGRWLARPEGEKALRVSRLSASKETRLLPVGAADSQFVFSPDGKKLAGHGLDGPAVRILETRTGKELHRLVGAQFVLLPHSFSGDGNFLLVRAHDSGTKQSWLAVWNLTSGKEVYRSEQEPPNCRLSPDGKVLAELYLDPKDQRQNGRFVLRDLASGKPQREYRLPAVPSSLFLSNDLGRSGDLITFTPDGSALVVIGSGDQEHLWLVKRNAHQAMDIPVLTGTIRAVAFSPDGRMLASAGKDGLVTLFETATGKQRRAFPGHSEPAGRLVFSPDGRRLASASEDTTVLVWDLKTPAEASRGKLAEKDLDKLWANLADGDAGRGFQAVQILADAEQGPAFLGTRLKPAPPPVNPKRLAELIGELDSNRFAVRSKATTELEKLGEGAEPAIRRALEKAPSLEARRRLETLLERCDASRPLTGEALRAVRAVEALEHQGSALARQILRTLADGAADARLTREAQAALGRLQGEGAGSR
jgi:WD40 repeat protein